MKFIFNGTLNQYITCLNEKIDLLNNDDLDLFNKQTKMEYKLSNDKCEILLEKDNQKNTEFWFVSSITEEDNCVIISGEIRNCLETNKDKILIVISYIFLWPIILFIWLMNEYTPFHAKKYRKNRLRKLMIDYIGCKEI